MLTVREIQEHLARISYKPGWSFLVYPGHWEGQHMVITTEVIDSYHPDKMTTLDVHSMLPPMANYEQLERWLGWRLGRIEIHEMREFLKRDGAPIFNPHADFADRDLQ